MVPQLLKEIHPTTLFNSFHINYSNITCSSSYTKNKRTSSVVEIGWVSGVGNPLVRQFASSELRWVIVRGGDVICYYFLGEAAAEIRLRELQHVGLLVFSL